jgi:hypothetical protein
VVEFKWKQKVTQESSPAINQAVLGTFYAIGTWSGAALSLGAIPALPYAILAFVTFYLVGWVVALIEWVIEANKQHKLQLQAV